MFFFLVFFLGGGISQQLLRSHTQVVEKLGYILLGTGMRARHLGGVGACYPRKVWISRLSEIISHDE